MGQRIGHSILRQSDGHYRLCFSSTGANPPYPLSRCQFRGFETRILTDLWTKDLETFTETACIG